MLKKIILALLIVFLVTAGVLAYLVFGKRSPPDGTATLIVPKGATTATIAADLDKLGLVRSPTIFRWLARVGNVDRHIKPGRYDFAKPVSTYDILQDLYHQHAVILSITFPEGWQIDRFARYAELKLGVSAARFNELCRDSLFLSTWPIPAADAEGYLLPAGYQFYWGAEPEEIVGELITATFAIFVDSLKTRMAELGWNIHQTLTMASLIEAEAGVAAERPRISAVFHNRLRKGIKLQCDPTVIYAMGGLDRRLLYRDLTFDSPYNTYLHYGLPPGPICNPGKPAVMAALYPPKSDELYFVARGDGTHIFSKTLREHNRARRKVKHLRGSN